MRTASDLGGGMRPSAGSTARGGPPGIEGADAPGRPGEPPGGADPAELHLSLENDPALVPPLAARLVAAAVGARPPDEGTWRRIELALIEAMLNGIYHGNLELDSAARHDAAASLGRAAALRRRRLPYRDRRLHVTARSAGASAVFVVRDEGPGFDPAAVPDPTAPDHRSRPCGRGLLMIRSFMDEVTFNAAGNQITLIKHLR